MSNFTATALITGGTSGLGYSTVRYIAQQRPDWRIIIASRDGSKAADKLKSELKRYDGRRRANVFFAPLDCSSMSSVRKFAQSYAIADHPPLKVLILNAGVQIVSDVKYSKDGFELTFATNHVGQALLLFLLQDHLGEDAKILYTGSGLHRGGRNSSNPLYVTAEECAHPREYPGWQSAKEGRRRYASSKLVNVLWLHALRDTVREQGKKWVVGGLEPGLIPGTGLARDSPFFMRFIWNYILPNFLFLIRKMIPNTYTPDQSGKVYARLALEDGLISADDNQTAYWQVKGPARSSESSYNVEWQKDLWRWTLKAVAESSTEKRRFEQLGLAS